ncbi:MAG TPA: hypothetical protein PLK35_00960 [Candidatus Moranbacteria bacterium]|nr:hypothetical protein [Candidatus Moranbacteria bacterium]
MKFTKKQIAVSSIIVFVIALILGLRSLTPEDEWVCEKGQWVAHGKPEAPKPAFSCVQKSAQLPSDTYCKSDKDCLCGVHKSKSICFTGNKSFVAESVQCKDFCSDGDDIKSVKCVKNKCKKAK